MSSLLELPENSVKVFISHGREHGKMQDYVEALVNQLFLVPHVLPRVDRFEVDQIAFLSAASEWRKKIWNEINSVDAAIICLDKHGAGSVWVKAEALWLEGRARSSPGFVVFYLHDGPLADPATPACEPWTHWDPIRPSDRQLVKRDDVDDLVRQVEELRPAPQNPGLSHLVPGLAGEVDLVAKRDLVATLRDKSSAISAALETIAKQEGDTPGSSDAAGFLSAALNDRWLISAYLSHLTDVRRRGLGLQRMNPLVNTLLGSVGGSTATKSERDLYAALLPLLPTEAEIGVVRGCFDPGPKPPAEVARVSQNRSAKPTPMLLTVGRSSADASVDGSPRRPVRRADLRSALAGPQPDQALAVPIPARTSAVPEEVSGYLSDVIALATGQEQKPGRLTGQILLGDTGDFDIDRREDEIADVLEASLARVLGGDDVDEYYMPDGSVEYPLAPVHLVVRCRSLNSAKAIDAKLSGAEASGLPRCSMYVHLCASRPDQINGWDGRHVQMDTDRLHRRQKDHDWWTTRLRPAAAQAI